MRKPISRADSDAREGRHRYDGHACGQRDAIARAVTLAREIPGPRTAIHAAAEFTADPGALERCRADIARGDIIINTMLFLEDHFQPLLPALERAARTLRRDGLRDVGGRSRQSDPHGPLRHERAD